MFWKDTILLLAANTTQKNSPRKGKPEPCIAGVPSEDMQIQSEAVVYYLSQQGGEMKRSRWNTGDKTEKQDNSFITENFKCNTWEFEPLP